LTPGEHFARLGEIIDTAKEMQGVQWPEGEGDGQLSAADQKENAERLAGIIAAAKTARADLRDYGRHRKEMGAIKRGELTESLQRLAAAHPDSVRLLESLGFEHVTEADLLPEA
jgi:hypothetical protein